MYDISIENLVNHPEHIEIVVKWIYDEWGDNNFEYWNSWIRNSIHENDIPQTFIVLVNGKIAGTYSLWRCDLQSRQDLFPWFGGLYISEEFRGKVYNGSKLGTIMQKHAIETLKSLGYKKAYLFSEKSPKYYKDNGWKYIGDTVDENDNKVFLCEYEIK